MIGNENLRVEGRKCCIAKLMVRKSRCHQPVKIGEPSRTNIFSVSN